MFQKSVSVKCRAGNVLRVLYKCVSLVFECLPGCTDRGQAMFMLSFRLTYSFSCFGSACVLVNGCKESAPTLPSRLTTHTIFKVLCPFCRDEFIRCGVPAQDTPRLFLDISRPSTILVQPGPPWVSGCTGSQGNEFLESVGVVRRDEWRGFLHV